MHFEVPCQPTVPSMSCNTFMQAAELREHEMVGLAVTAASEVL